MNPHSPQCQPHCISGEQLKAALEILGLWFDGNILSVKIGGRPQGYPMTGHRSSWFAEVEAHHQPNGEGPYETRLIRVPVHPGPSEMDRMVREFEEEKDQ